MNIMNIADILIPIALLLNCISIHRLWKRVDNMGAWINYLLRKDYVKHKTEKTGRECK